MRIAIVTGASSGMGREFLRRIDDLKLDEIWGIGLGKEQLDKVKQETKTNLRVFDWDLTDKENIQKFKTELEKNKPQVEWLVNASGFGKFGRYDEIPVEQSINMIELNCVALVSMTEYALPYMVNGARIVQFGSVAAFQPIPYINVYGASKAFVLNYSRGLNRELKNRNISVTCVCPFWTKTQFFKRAVDPNNDRVVSKYVAMYDPVKVIDKAYKDSLKRKEITIYGLISNLQTFMVRVLPKSWIMNMWISQQGLKKKYKNK